MENEKNPGGESWVNLAELLARVPVHQGTLTEEADWEKLPPGDPGMDETERTLFPEETYRCSRCGHHEYFGVKCSGDQYCRHCGARMRNAGRRE